MTSPSSAGPWSRRRLLGQGYTDRRLARAVAEGRLLRLRRGVYAAPEMATDLRVALTDGGRLSCASELRRLGVWVHETTPRVHVRMPVGRHPYGAEAVVRHWSPTLETGSDAELSVVDALVDAVSCLSPFAAVAAVDSCLNKGLLLRSSLPVLAAEAGRRRRWLRRVDGRADSGLETIARLRLQMLGIPCRPQWRFDGVGRVDLLVAGRLVVEADGDAYHLSRDARRNDRRRDALLADRGYPVMRFGAEQLLSSAPDFEVAVIGMLARLRGVNNCADMVRTARKRLGLVDLDALLHGGRRAGAGGAAMAGLRTAR